MFLIAVVLCIARGTMNQEKLKKLQAQVRIGGKGTPRRKKKVIHQTPGTDDKKLQSVLKKLAVNQIPGIEEVNMIKNDGTVIHFNNPKAQASLAANTFAITGHSEQKEVSLIFFLCCLTAHNSIHPNAMCAVNYLVIFYTCISIHIEGDNYIIQL